MLPSANRKERETLKIFQDSGAYAGVFPADDDYLAHAALLERAPNLDTLGDPDDVFGRAVVMSSLGNLVRLMRPIFILDEGQKAASANAQATLRDFNPSLMIELSATPPPGANLLVDVRGRELEREDMLKLDLHVVNEGHAKWQSTLSRAKEHRDFLEEQARAHDANTGLYIRPICLIQVERTGREQRIKGFIHALDAFDYLTGTLGVPPEQIAIKSSSQDDLAEVDDAGGLLSRDCPYRYIITKQALQEGWDCPFAYVLAILGNPKSATALTQLIGRVLRQPHGRKTKNAFLDESYVFCFQREARGLLAEIKKGFELEGLGDLSGSVSSGSSLKKIETQVDQRRAALQKQRVALPVFAVKSGKTWRQASYAMDIAARIDWARIDLSTIEAMELSEAVQGFELAVDLGEKEGEGSIKIGGRKSLRGKLEDGDALHCARHLMQVAPNPWRAFEFSEKILGSLVAKHGAEKVGDNFMRVVEHAQLEIERQRDELGKEIFEKMLDSGEMAFQVLALKGVANWSVPGSQTRSKTGKRMTRADGAQLQRSLFEFVDDAEVDNPLERDVACFLDEQEQLLFWYRSVPRRDYYIQGWQPNKIWPDFVAARKGQALEGIVIESKGDHLIGNKDTVYKEAVFEMCGARFVAKAVGDGHMPSVDIPAGVQFKVVGQSTWRQELLSALGKGAPAAKTKAKAKKKGGAATL